MICGLGIDIVGVDRIKTMLDHAGFIEKCYTRGELAYLDARGKARGESAAGMFAAKEAMLKALGTGMGGIGLLEVAVSHAASGAPLAELSTRAAARLAELGADTMHISITHAEGVAVAVAIAERR